MNIKIFRFFLVWVRLSVILLLYTILVQKTIASDIPPKWFSNPLLLKTQIDTQENIYLATARSKNPDVPPNESPFDAKNNVKVRRFINEVAAAQNIDWTVVQALLNRAKWSQTALKLTQPRKPHTKRKRNWPRYRQGFLKDSRIRLGIDFWLEYDEKLKQAEEQYGVPVPIIVSILNIESRFGKQMGRYKVLDVLATLAFYHATRDTFYQQQLAALIQLWRQDNFNLDDLVGSYAGAIGMGQFLPTSIIAYAIDFDRDGHINLDEPDDMIGSVANFLARHGWNRMEGGTDILIPITVEEVAAIGTQKIQKWLAEGPKPTIVRKSLASVGISDSILDSLTFPVALIDLPGPQGVEYRLGSWNYYVITRYNRSFDYATAVYDLAQAMACLIKPSVDEDDDRLCP